MGRCPALPHCAPIRDGDRWQCNRPHLRGGPCEEGPAPDGTCCHTDHCTPIRSLRSRRRQFVVAIALLSIGTFLFVLNSKARETVLKPGPLAHNHAQILADASGPKRCATCHESAHGGMTSWLAATLLPSSKGKTQSELCLECHRKTIHEDFALLAHNVSTTQLTTLTKKYSQREGNSLLESLGKPTNSSGEIACASCHREHHGAEFDLTLINDDACQACHTERYHSFADDHPEFSVWPFERRTRIIFDHASHSSKHFPEKRAEFACAQCHQEDVNGITQLTLSYEQSCASCHDEQMTGNIGPGIALFALPSIDLEAFSNAGHRIGDWPEWATGDFDGPIPSMMKLMLAADPEAARAMQLLGEDFEFADIDPDDPEHLKAAATLVQAIKQLFAQLSKQGPSAALDRIRLSRIGDTDYNELLLAGLSRETLQAAQQKWLPKIRLATNEVLDKKTKTDRLVEPQVFSPVGVWSIDNNTFSLRYQPAGHADPLLTAWLNALAGSGRISSDSLLRTVFRELTSPNGPGMCASCHSIDRSESGLMAVNWKSFDHSSATKQFTRFTHGLHLIQPALRDCTYCHSIDKSANTAVSYSDDDPNTFTSDFYPMKKQDCATCHTQHAAGDRCQSCHNYHVGE